MTLWLIILGAKPIYQVFAKTWYSVKLRFDVVKHNTIVGFMTDYFGDQVYIPSFQKLHKQKYVNFLRFSGGQGFITSSSIKFSKTL